MTTYSILFEYAGGGTDRVRLEARNSQDAVRQFNRRYDDRYIISVSEE